MSGKVAKIGATSIILIAAFVGLLWTTLSEGTEYYKHVDEVLSTPNDWYGKKLQLHGYAVDVRRRPNSLDYLFQIENNGKIVQARYSGVVPDTFKDGAEVVAKGILGPDGFAVERDGIMAKCPSKYEASTAQPGSRAPGY